MTDIVESLLPCPFCGAAARTDLLPHSGGPGWVQCSECECDQYMCDTIEEAVAKWNRRAPAQAVTGHPRHNVYFMCQCCEEENPENAVCCREDIAVMPDGTWLCDNCYSDCEKTAYGLVASDIEDFEFPQFEDLPRPAPYIDLALSSAHRNQATGE
jgi:hypothetical protein